MPTVLNDNSPLGSSLLQFFLHSLYAIRNRNDASGLDDMASDGGDGRFVTHSASINLNPAMTGAVEEGQVA